MPSFSPDPFAYLRRRALGRVGGGGGAVVVRTYAQFQAHIATLTANTDAWGTTDVSTAGAFRTTAAAATGTMSGSSWNSVFGTLVTPCRFIQHGLPSQAAFDDQVANGREIYYVLASAGTSTTTALARNGYTSNAAGSASVLSCTDLIYWDGAQAQRMNPSTATGPTPYSF